MGKDVLNRIHDRHSEEGCYGHSSQEMKPEGFEVFFSNAMKRAASWEGITSTPVEE
jgi:hypothetical protein